MQVENFENRIPESLVLPVEDGEVYDLIQREIVNRVAREEIFDEPINLGEGDEEKYKTAVDEVLMEVEGYKVVGITAMMDIGMHSSVKFFLKEGKDISFVEICPRQESHFLVDIPEGLSLVGRSEFLYVTEKRLINFGKTLEKLDNLRSNLLDFKV